MFATVYRIYGMALCPDGGWQAGTPCGPGSANFEAMREWNRAEVYRKTIGYFADPLVRR